MEFPRHVHGVACIRASQNNCVAAADNCASADSRGKTEVGRADIGMGSENSIVVARRVSNASVEANERVVAAHCVEFSCCLADEGIRKTRCVSKSGSLSKERVEVSTVKCTGSASEERVIVAGIILPGSRTEEGVGEGSRATRLTGLRSEK